MEYFNERVDKIDYVKDGLNTIGSIKKEGMETTKLKKKVSISFFKCQNALTNFDSLNVFILRKVNIGVMKT